MARGRLQELDAPRPLHQHRGKLPSIWRRPGATGRSSARISTLCTARSRNMRYDREIQTVGSADFRAPGGKSLCHGPIIRRRGQIDDSAIVSPGGTSTGDGCRTVVRFSRRSSKRGECRSRIRQEGSRINARTEDCYVSGTVKYRRAVVRAIGAGGTSAVHGLMLAYAYNYDNLFGRIGRTHPLSR